MRWIKLIRVLQGLVIVAATVAAAYAQTPAPAASSGAQAPSKIATVDTDAFADNRGGITRLVSAFSAVEREFKPLRDEVQGLKTRFDALTRDIEATKTIADQKSLAAKVDQAATMKRDLERRQQDGQDALEKRVRESTGPIYEDISKALQAFARQRGIDVIFDVSKLNGVMLIVNDTVDITNAFMADYNQRNPATSVPAGRPK